MDKKGIYGFFAGMSSAMILQPLDNIKMVLIMPPKQLNFSTNFVKNIYLSANYLASDEGFRSFYKGLIPNIVKTGFSSGIYFYSLRAFQKINQIYQIADKKNFTTNFVYSSFGRILSCSLSNPFSILQTRHEIAGKERWSGGVVKGLHKLHSTEGFKGLFRGCLVNCYKQGIFAGLFYGMYEQGKKLGFDSTLSGIVSGMIATLLTHPFQIVRTQLQTANVFFSTHGQWLKMSVRNQLVELFRSGQLLKGVSPRLIKKPLSNTIAFVIFQNLQKHSSLSQ